jgi:hypothetical protein
MKVTPLLVHVILQLMAGGEINSYPILLLVNYWETHPSMMGTRLDDLLRRGVTNIATFVPWQAVESDISHTLPRFIQAVVDRNMNVSLILTPEAGVHYSNSGLPKDIFSKPESLAQDCYGEHIPVQLPPNSFALPSLSASEFTKRYHNFLSRMDSLLADMGRTQPLILEAVTLVLTGSYWKYYRAARDSSARSFEGAAGDYSGAASVAYRQRVEQFFNQREFLEPNASAAARWKTRALEEINRRWFYQQSEDVFRNRSRQFVRKRARQLNVRQIELFTPEADPGFTYSSFLQVISGVDANLGRLSTLVDDAASRASHAGADGSIPSYIHWAGLGGFSELSDPERQFLILKSLLLMASWGRITGTETKADRGGILIDEAEWFKLSQSFRTRAEAFARALSHSDLNLRGQVLYLAPHLWSGAGILWEEIRNKLGARARFVATTDLILNDRDSKLLIVDPTVVLTKEIIQKLIAWAKGGRSLILPRGALYTEAAKAELEQACMSANGGMNITLGIPYRLFAWGEGKILLYDVPEGLASQGNAMSAWQTFVGSVLSLAGLQAPCSTSDGRLRLIALEKKDGKRK